MRALVVPLVAVLALPAVPGGGSARVPTAAPATTGPARGIVEACGTGAETAADLVARHLSRGALAALPTPHSADVDGIAVLEDDGTFFFTTKDGHPVLDLAAAARAFYRTHGDGHEALAFYLASGLSTWLGSPGALAAAYVVRNQVDGIGLDRFDFGAGFGSPARLEVLLSMNGLHRYLDDPDATAGLDQFTPLDFLAHEFGHRYSAYVRVDSAGQPVPALLGRAWQHWNFFADVDGSVMEGCDWTQVGPDSFRTTAVTTGFGRLDLYLMGLASKSETTPVFVVNDPSAFDPPGVYVPYSIPNPDLSCRGRATSWTVDDIEAVHGPRVPDAATAPKSWRVGFVLVVPRGQAAAPADLAKLGALRARFGPWFDAATGGRGAVDVGLASRAGTVAIAHEPLRDAEDPAAPRAVGARVSVVPGGIPIALDPGAVRLHWRANGGPWSEAPMAAAGPDSFVAELPGPGPPGTVEYWIEAASDSAGIVAWNPPAGPAAPHPFALGPDLVPPVIVHVPPGTQAAARLPQTLLARVTDNLGVDSVWVEWSVAGGPAGAAAVAPAGRDSFAVALGAGLAPGARLAYRFVARDASAARNAAGADAGFDTLAVGRDWLHGFENGAEGWVHAPFWYSYRDAWHLSSGWAAEPGGTSWKCGSSDATPYPPHLDAALVSPVIAELEPGTVLRFEHRYDLEEAGGGYAWDGARVEVSVAGGPWQIALPAAGYSHVFWLDSNPFQRGTPCWSGTSGPRVETVDLGAFAPGPARVRFRMLADDFLGAEGWFVDRVRLETPDGTVAVAGPGDPLHPVGAPAPNPSRAGVRLALGLPAAAEVAWEVFDLQGRRVATLWRGRVAAGPRELSSVLPRGIRPGLYFSRVSLDGRPAAATRLAVVR